LRLPPTPASRRPRRYQVVELLYMESTAQPLRDLTSSDISTAAPCRRESRRTVRHGSQRAHPLPLHDPSRVRGYRHPGGQSCARRKCNMGIHHLADTGQSGLALGLAARTWRRAGIDSPCGTIRFCQLRAMEADIRTPRCPPPHEPVRWRALLLRTFDPTCRLSRLTASIDPSLTMVSLLREQSKIWLATQVGPGASAAVLASPWTDTATTPTG